VIARGGQLGRRAW